MIVKLTMCGRLDKEFDGLSIEEVKKIMSSEFKDGECVIAELSELTIDQAREYGLRAEEVGDTDNVEKGREESAPSGQAQGEAQVVDEGLQKGDEVHKPE